MRELQGGITWSMLINQMKTTYLCSRCDGSLPGSIVGDIKYLLIENFFLTSPIAGRAPETLPGPSPGLISLGVRVSTEDGVRVKLPVVATAQIKP